MKGKWWLAVWVGWVCRGRAARSNDLRVRTQEWDCDKLGPLQCDGPRNHWSNLLQAGHAPAFSTPGELLEAYNNLQVKAMVWLT